MGLMALGGWMMWPLLAVSVAALAIIVERALIFMSCPFPDRAFSGLVLEAARTGDAGPLAAHLGRVPMLRDFAGLLDGPARSREAALRLAGEEVLARLEARLPFLSMLARLAPLMGLLGTILGMIATFSRIAGAASGVDMTLLAGGIWQALLTTAAGLCIAIPALFFLSLFQGRVRRVAEALNRAGNAALLADAPAGSRAETERHAGDPGHAGTMQKEAAERPLAASDSPGVGASAASASGVPVAAVDASESGRGGAGGTEGAGGGRPC